MSLGTPADPYALDRYYRNPRPELTRTIVGGPHRILEVGCAEGLVGGRLKQEGLAREVIGIELDPDAAAVARGRLDEVHCGDLERMDLASGPFRPASFDHVICGDVIEHLREPEVAVARLLALLKPGGTLIVSVPNVRHWTVSLGLVVGGEWRYQPAGIMDRTHLRFFTRRSILRLFQEAGTDCLECRGIFWTKLDKLGRLASLGLAREFFTRQWVLVVRHGDPARAA